jgi:formylglycine-generating enzyme required for sulfatase activity
MASNSTARTATDRPDMIGLEGGRFRMRSDRHYPEATPARIAAVGGFWIDAGPVTNRQFAAFVEATGYRAFAETPPDPADCPGIRPEGTVSANLQQFASTHAAFHNHFQSERHLVSREIYRERRSAALAEWQTLAA